MDKKDKIDKVTKLTRKNKKQDEENELGFFIGCIVFGIAYVLLTPRK